MPIINLSTSVIANYSISYLMDKDEYLKQMSEFALNNENSQSYKTNVYAKMSESDIFNNTKLFDSFIDDLKKIIQHIPWIEKGHSFSIYNLWTVVYNKGDFTWPHHHGDFISIVFCLEDGGRSHPIIFTDSDLEIEMHSGKMVIFPGHIKHHVPVYRYNKPRIMLACNIKIDEGRFNPTYDSKTEKLKYE